MRIQHILVPVDFSERAQAALGQALELADKFSARITLLHVLENIFPPVTEVAVLYEEQFSDMHREAENELQKLAESAAGRAPVTTAIETGEPWDCIVNYAERQEVDLIVLDTHGRSGLKHLLLGSVAERVVQHAPCAVFVVRQRRARENGGSAPRGAK
jgi:nucleotide-binding universal stress UspA family protein